MLLFWQLLVSRNAVTTMKQEMSQSQICASSRLLTKVWCSVWRESYWVRSGNTVCASARARVIVGRLHSCSGSTAPPMFTLYCRGLSPSLFPLQLSLPQLVSPRLLPAKPSNEQTELGWVPNHPTQPNSIVLVINQNSCLNQSPTDGMCRSSLK